MYSFAILRPFDQKEVVVKRLVLLILLFFSTLYPDDEFFQLMGKETPHWIHVSKTEDTLALEKFGMLYEANKNLRFTEEGPYKIPKVIHFIWLGPQPFPPQSVENIRSWLAYHPDWKIKFWTDRERLPPCNDMEVCLVDTFPFLFLRHCYEESENWGEKSDVLRFEILYQEGGVYADHDASCLQKFDGLHRGYDFYCGLESPHPPIAGRNITSGNGVIGSRSFHPVIGRVIELIGKEWKDIGLKYRGRDGYSRTQLVMERTYIRLTEGLMDRLCEDGNVDIIFPAAFFFAKKGISPLYSRHFFANAWADEAIHDAEFKKSTRRALFQLQNRNKIIRLIGRGALSLNLMVLVGIFFYLIRKKRKYL
ncbi:MAG: Subversion of eukaryotic traffic protein A [Chlamydiae bacterium]|nr:Subversion of eukaryotic traffic protein A [Chlamydiota bacterium]